MRVRSTVTVLTVAAAGSALAFTGGGATAAQPASAAGGGQVEINTRGGAGDTIAFTAKDTDGKVTENAGQVQYVNRSADGQTVQHGVVTCVTIEGNSAEISGTWRDPADPANSAFTIYVMDNEQGSAAENDVVTVMDVSSPQCGDDFQGEGDVQLARGNVQVRPGS